MADISMNVRNLVVRVIEANGKALEAVVTFTVGPGDAPDNWTITISRVNQQNLDRLVSEFMKTISQADDVVRDTVVEKDYTIALQ